MILCMPTYEKPYIYNGNHYFGGSKARRAHLPGSTAKAFLEINGGDHFCANSGYPDEDILGKYGIAWMKRFIDEDRRYDQFLCGPNHEADRSISEYRDTCNY